MAPVALGLNGNALTVSKVLFEGAARREKPRLAFGHVFPFSSHHYQLRLCLRAGHLDPDEDVKLVVVPPRFMVWTLRKGQVDGFCVGAPWNSLAVAAGGGDHSASRPGRCP